MVVCCQPVLDWIWKLIVKLISISNTYYKNYLSFTVVLCLLIIRCVGQTKHEERSSLGHFNREERSHCIFLFMMFMCHILRPCIQERSWSFSLCTYIFWYCFHFAWWHHLYVDSLVILRYSYSCLCHNHPQQNHSYL